MVAIIGFYGIIDDVTFNEDAAIVLGAGIKGEQVTRLLSYRLDKAAEYSANKILFEDTVSEPVRLIPYIFAPIVGMSPTRNTSPVE